MLRALYLLIGLVTTALGILGTFLPVLPTTPFLLISLWAFAKSSRRLETWLLEHPRLGPRLVEWRTYRVIPWRVKITAWATMAASLGFMVLTGTPWQAMVGAASLMAIGVIYVASKPSRVPEAGARPEKTG